MAQNIFSEGVKPGGLTTSAEIRILICYLLDSIGVPISRNQLEEALLGEELANYFVLAESLSYLEEQGLIGQTKQGYYAKPEGKTVGQTLAIDVPRSVRESAGRALIRAQEYVALQSAYQSSVLQKDNGYIVQNKISDESGSLFSMDLYLPDALSAETAKQCFVQNGATIYKLVLSALTSGTDIPPMKKK